MNKEVKMILISLGLYALSGGIFYSFQELWMASNNLSVKTIGTIWSIGSLLSVSVIFLSSNLIKRTKLKKFATTLFLLKSIIIFLLFLLNNSGLNVLIKFLILCDNVIDIEIFASIYPLITIITKDDKIFATRGLVNSFLYYIGVLIASFLLGKNFLLFNFNYNSYLFIASIIAFLGFIVLKNTDLDKYYPKNDDENQGSVLHEVIHKLKDDKITHNYFCFLFFGDICYYTITSLIITILTEYLNFSPSVSGYIVLFVGILSAILGLIVLSKLTFKNNYVNLSIKLCGRLIMFLIAIFLCSNGSYFMALIFTKITADSYTHITDAPYINRFDGKYQLAFCNLREMVKYSSKSLGIFMCSFLLAYGIKYNFLVAAILICIQIFFGFNALRLRNLEMKELK